MHIPPKQTVEQFRATRHYLPRAEGQGGGGKGGKGGGGGGVDRPNTLQSKTIVGIVDLLSEGPIGGLVNGGQSIYFNNAPLMNSEGGYNFKGVTWQLQTGTPDQPAIPGFPAVSDAVQLGEQITHEAPVEYTIANTLCTRATVTIEIPSLYNVDTRNGNTNPNQVNISIEVAGQDGNRVTVINDTINGKTESPYETSYTFQLPDVGPWNIYVFRNTPDPTVSTDQNLTYLSAVDEIIDNLVGYADSAVIGLTFDSEYFGSTIPARTYAIQGLLIQIPANYNPVTRTYASTGPGTSGGTWDGVTFTSAVTDNPAWIVYDMISNNRYGMGLPSGALAGCVWDLYVIGQYCDQLVPDGFGGTEPRFTCNMCINQQDDAYRVLQGLTGIFRGMSYWGAGTIRFTADMPMAISQIVNQADVINGNFTYEGTALNARYTAAMVNYTDPSNYWNPTPVFYQDPNLMVQSIIGPNIQQVNALGATTAGQALRQGKWLIVSADLQQDTVTYQAALDHLTLRPGEIIGVVDPAYQNVNLGGRVLSVTPTTIDGDPGYELMLDRGVAQVDGATYTFSIMLTDGTVADQISIVGWVQNDSGTTTITIDETLQPPEAGAIWYINASYCEPRQFKVIGATQPQRGIVEITALYNDPQKFDIIEYGLDLTAPPFSVLPPLITGQIGDPTNITVADYWIGEGTTTVLRTTLGWTAPDDSRVVSYDISISSVGGYSGQMTGVAGPSQDIDNLPSGDTYTFNVRSRTSDNRTGDWVASSPTLINGNQANPPAPNPLVATGGFASVALSWGNLQIFNLWYYEVWRASVTDGVVNGFTLVTQTASITYTDADSTVLTPNTTWAYEVRAVTTTGLDGAFTDQVQATTTTVDTGDLTPDAVTSFVAQEESADVQGSGLSNLTEVLSTSLDVPAGGNREAFIIVNGNQGLHSDSTNDGYRYQVLMNGSVVYDRSVSLYADYPCFSDAITLVAGQSNTFVVNWAGNDDDVYLLNISLVVMGRAA